MTKINKNNIVIINARFLTQNITGVQRYAIEVSKYLKKIFRDKITFVSPKNIIHEEISKEIKSIIIGKRTGHLWEQLDLPIFLRKHNYPLLLNLGNTAPLFYKNKISTVYDLAFYHHPEWFSRNFALFYNFLIPKLLKNSKHILTDSNFVKDEMNRIYNINLLNISVIHGAPSALFKIKEFKDLEKYVLCVGSIDPRKNLVRIIEIFTKLKKINLIIVGDKNKAFANINVKEIASNITFTGYIQDQELLQLYNKATLFLYPSYYEGFGIPPLEAQASGCPVIASNVASLPEVCGNSVLYCNPYDSNDIMNKVIDLYNDDELRQDLIKKGFDNIQRFSWEKSARQMAGIISRFL